MSSSSESIKLARLLIVDDELNTCMVLKKAFDLIGYHVDAVQSGEQALEMLKQKTYDLMLLDLRMPGISGVQVMKYVNEQHLDIQVIIMTAHATLESAISAVKAGAYDYLIKPQKISEIQMVVEKALKKHSIEKQRENLIKVIHEEMQAFENNIDPQTSTSLENEEVKLNIGDQNAFLHLENRRFVIQNEKLENRICVELTTIEFALLAELMQHPNKVLSSRDLAIKALGYSYISEHDAKGIIRPHITRLRKKIEADSSHPIFIRTVRGKGYTFSPI
ncbi:MAG: response regulator transcription factor [Anaerolineaceae bacterium]|nr:response regulator transcription factor [Anaerolineaceae bacterium]